MVDIHASSFVRQLAGDSNAPTLAGELRRLHLVHRSGRFERVLGMLRERHRERSLIGPVPAGLSEAIAGFSEELALIRAELSMTSASTDGDRAVPSSGMKVTGKARR
jgi:hypothetical protein